MAMVKQKVFLLVISPSVSYHSVAERDEIALILLQIVMVSPGTHLVKNHESLSITNESQLKKKNKTSKITKGKKILSKTKIRHQLIKAVIHANFGDMTFYSFTHDTLLRIHESA